MLKGYFMSLFSKFTVLALVCASCFCSYAQAISVGREGEPYEINGVTWQNVAIEGEKYKLAAALPGAATSRLMNSTAESISISEDNIYFIRTNDVSNEKPPKKFPELVKYLADLVDNLTPLHVKTPFILGGEYSYTGENGEKGITRILVTKNKFYLVGAFGLNPEHFEDVYNSVKVTEKK
jgi:hypothetical protein